MRPSPAYLEADWRREALRTNLCVVPALEAVVVLLFAGTHALDQAGMIQRSNVDTVPERADRDDVTRRYETLIELYELRTAPATDVSRSG